jgi:urocanate hydratase
MFQTPNRRVGAMDNFKAEYRILNYLKLSEKNDEFDGDCFNAGYFGLTERQWLMTLIRMLDDGHIKGVGVKIGADGYGVISLPNPMITTKGLEPLAENSFMRKAANAAKNIREILPV